MINITLLHSRVVLGLWLGASLYVLTLNAPAATTLIATNSNWRYLADGSDQGAVWQDPLLDDSGWSNGVARLGFGSDGEVTSIGSPTNSFITFYFRHSFIDPGTNLFTQVQARLLYDDGAVVYLNGVELFRQNMLTGEVSHLTFASSSVDGASEAAFFTTNVPAAVALLQPGLNVLAVEIHQSTNASSDLGFDFELTAIADSTPPTIVDTNQPASSVVMQGRSITLSVAASGSPPLSYQWFFKQGSSAYQPLPGANSDTYSITNMQLTNEGAYYVSITNSYGVTDSPIATVGFVPDADPPIIVSLNSVTNNRIGLCFSETVTLPSAINPLNYTVDAGFSIVTNVVFRADGKSVELYLGSPVDKFFSVAVTNIEDLAGNLTADARTGYISQYTSTTVGTLGNPDPAGSVYSCFWDSFDVTVGGDIGGTSDHFHFVSREVVGDFDARVRVTRLDFAGQLSKAGLMARETLSADSRTLQTYFTPIAGANQVEVALRATPGGGTTDTDFQTGLRAPADPLRWLRITRTNATFTTYHGEDGVHWAISGMTTQAFNATLYVGMAAAAATTSAAPLPIRASSQSSGATTTAGFTDFFVLGAQPGDEIVPTLVASIEAATLRLQWDVTPRDFTVEVSSDFIEWTTLLLPIEEGLGGRSMVIPLEPGQSQLIARLTRVEKVIVASQAKAITPGIILSPENKGLKLSNISGNLCSSSLYPVEPGTTLIQTASAISIPTSTTRYIDTLQSSTGVNTVLQVRNANFSTFCNDDESIYTTKSKVFPLPSGTTFKLVVGAKAGTTPTSVIQVYINY